MNMTPNDTKPLLEIAESPLEDTNPEKEMESPLDSPLLTAKPLVEMTDKELAAWHSRLRSLSLSPPTLAAHIREGSVKKAAKSAKHLAEQKVFDEYA